jgi:hypothetical protein
MDDTSRRGGQDGCPHLNRDDARCASRLCLGRLEQAFSVCFGAFHVCPMYHIINREADGELEPASARPLIAARVALTPLTMQEQRIARRATGT